MANVVYEKARDNFAKGNIAWVSDSIWIALIDTNDYVVDVLNHADMTSVPDAAIVAQVALTSKITDGFATVDAANPVFPDVVGDPCEAVIIYKRVNDGSGNIIKASSLLIAYMDTAPGLPVDPNGTDVNITFSDLGIFKL